MYLSQISSYILKVFHVLYTTKLYIRKLERFLKWVMIPDAIAPYDQKGFVCEN